LVLFCVRALEYRQAGDGVRFLFLSFAFLHVCPRDCQRSSGSFFAQQRFFVSHDVHLISVLCQIITILFPVGFSFLISLRFVFFVPPAPPPFFLSFFHFALGEEEPHFGAAVSSGLCRDPEAWKKKQQKKNHHHIIVRGILFVAVHHDATDKHEDGSPLLVCCRGACI
jgi:hypothetical protein